MWKAYTRSAVKNNRAASAAIITAVLISAAFISLISGIFYNLWTDNIRRTIAAEGDWQGTLTAQWTEDSLSLVQRAPNVDRVVLEAPAADGRQAARIYLKNPRTTYEDLPALAGLAGIDSQDPSAVQYNNLLLTQYFIYSPQEKKDPPLLLGFYLCVLVVLCFSLVLIIYNAFSVSMNARLHQLGILQSVGATPRQIRAALMQEAFALSLLPMLLGIGAGIGLNAAFVHFSNLIGSEVQRQAAVFDYSPWVFLAALAACLLTVGLSAWVPARRLSRMTPMEAIRGGDSKAVEKVRSFRLLSRLFGLEGELAGKSLYVRRKAFRTATVSLTLSFLVFSVFLNFMTLSDISTQQTYFERYKDKWDLLATLEEADAADPALLARIREIPGVESGTAYRKVDATTTLSPELLSDELKALGGPEALKDTGITVENGSYRVQAPILVLDDASFQAYCEKAGIRADESAAPPAVTVNRIWDNTSSHFRAPVYKPFIRQADAEILTLYSPGGKSVQLETTAFTDQTPELREEYEDFALMQVMPESTFARIAGNFERGALYISLLTASEDQIAGAEAELAGLLDQTGSACRIENRQADEAYNTAARNALNVIMGVLCGLMAFIGIANVFANVLGHISQRKREFARYLSVGMTPGGVWRVLSMEALIIGLRPILISLPFNVLFIIFAVNASKLAPAVFIQSMPLIPLAAFAIVVLAAVGLAYAAGGRIICRSAIADTLKDDTLF
ncbi:ABC transporter permease [Eubacterium sp. 1001713B170207_170306_E7]|uniref:ABC transporter permease n=1 Tax=Eubacterium sp. 1001713B170207_170306_E7 TaxID=2787097 RepID=UPI001898FC8A|nr:ABC transporter permease [Eubacterium sp. 1001713B170207_170306_E7]